MKNKYSPLAHGQELVEFAMTLPTLAVLIFESAVQHAAREGARFAIVHPDDTSGVINRVKDRAIGIKSSDPNFNVGLGDDIGNSGDDWNDEDFVQVQIEYSFRIATPFVGRFFDNGMISMSASSTMQREKW